GHGGEIRLGRVRFDFGLAGALASALATAGVLSFGPSRLWSWQARRLAVAAVTHDVGLQLHVVLERPVRLKAERLQNPMVRSDRLLRVDLAVGDESQTADERKLVLGVVDFAAEEGDTSDVLLGFGKQLERVVRGPGRTTQDADDQMRIVMNQF